MKRVMMIELDTKELIKVEHEVKGMVSGVSIFSMDEFQVQEILPGVLSKEEEALVISGEREREATPDEIEAIHVILDQRDAYVMERVSEATSVIGGTTLLRLLELGGRYFTYTLHDNLLYTRIAEVLLTPDDLPVDFIEVPLEFLPVVAENISGVLMQDKKKGVTLQFGEGLFLRLKRFSQTIFGTVIVLEGEGEEGKLRAPYGFVLKNRDGAWTHVDDTMVGDEKMEEEMEKALGHVVNELSLSTLKK